jgi:hypothetical protein
MLGSHSAPIASRPPSVSSSLGLPSFPPRRSASAPPAISQFSFRSNSVRSRLYLERIKDKDSGVELDSDARRIPTELKTNQATLPVERAAALALIERTHVTLLRSCLYGRHTRSNDE